MEAGSELSPEELELVRKASDGVRDLEAKLRGENVELYVAFAAGDVRLAWVREKVSRKWRIMALAPGQPEARPLSAQPVAVRLQVHPHLASFGDAVRAACRDSEKMAGPDKTERRS